MFNQHNYADFCGVINKFKNMFRDVALSNKFAFWVINLYNDPALVKIRKRDLWKRLNNPQPYYSPRTMSVADKSAALKDPIFAGLRVAIDYEGKRRVFLEGLWRIPKAQGQIGQIALAFPVDIDIATQKIIIEFKKPYLVKKNVTFHRAVLHHALSRYGTSLNMTPDEQKKFDDFIQFHALNHYTIEDEHFKKNIAKFAGIYYATHESNSSQYPQKQYALALEKICLSTNFPPSQDALAPVKKGLSLLYTVNPPPPQIESGDRFFQKHYEMVPLVRGLDLGSLLRALSSIPNFNEAVPGQAHAILFQDILLLAKEVPKRLIDLLSRLHQANILHLDIKLGNIVFHRIMQQLAASAPPTVECRVEFINFDLAINKNKYNNHTFLSSPYYESFDERTTGQVNDIRALLRTIFEWLFGGEGSCTVKSDPENWRKFVEISENPQENISNALHRLASTQKGPHQGITLGTAPSIYELLGKFKNLVPPLLYSDAIEKIASLCDDIIGFHTNAPLLQDSIFERIKTQIDAIFGKFNLTTFSSGFMAWFSLQSKYPQNADPHFTNLSIDLPRQSILNELSASMVYREQMPLPLPVQPPPVGSHAMDVQEEEGFDENLYEVIVDRQQHANVYRPNTPTTADSPGDSVVVTNPNAGRPLPPLPNIPPPDNSLYAAVSKKGGGLARFFKRK